MSEAITYADNAASPDLASYDRVVVAFSGGKDSLACVLTLLEAGVPRERIELWHHDVDGREGSTLMDWRCTRDYCRKVAQALGCRLYFSWKLGGFEREMTRENALTAPIAFETPDGTRVVGGERGKLNTRRLFPQVSGDLSVRWCSAYLKIDVGSVALRGQERFNNSRTLFVTGERGQESAGRAGYAAFEPHRTDLRDGKKARHVDHWRPVHKWDEREVWDIIRRWGIVPHPAYRLGWGRVSCAACIFGSSDQWASLRAVNRGQFKAVARYEAAFGKTIKRSLSVIQAADRGTPYAATTNAALVELATSEAYDAPVRVEPSAWELPAGAFGESCGPT